MSKRSGTCMILGKVRRQVSSEGAGWESEAIRAANALWRRCRLWRVDARPWDQGDRTGLKLIIANGHGRSSGQIAWSAPVADRGFKIAHFRAATGSAPVLKRACLAVGGEL